MKKTAHPNLSSGVAARRAFTLLELIMAMATFTILMFAAFSFFGSAQSTWRGADTSTRIYENARIAFSIISTDLQCAVANERPGEELPFMPSSATEIRFVSAIPGASSAASDLCGIAYMLDTAKSILTRKRSDSFAPGSTTITAASASDPAIASGVVAVSFVCIDAAGVALLPTTINTLPAQVIVTITLVDEKLVAAGPTSSSDAAKNKGKRTFSRTFYIGNRG